MIQRRSNILDLMILTAMCAIICWNAIGTSNLNVRLIAAFKKIPLNDARLHDWLQDDGWDAVSISRDPKLDDSVPPAPSGLRVLELKIDANYQHANKLAPPWTKLGYSGYVLVQYHETFDKLRYGTMIALLITGVVFVVFRRVRSTRHWNSVCFCNFFS